MPTYIMLGAKTNSSRLVIPTESDRMLTRYSDTIICFG